MKKTLIMLFALSIMFTGKDSFPCAVFNATQNNKTLVANNEGWYYAVNPHTIHKIRVIPETRDSSGKVIKFGKIILISDDGTGESIEGGINDQGLVYDGCTVPGSLPMKPTKIDLPETADPFNDILDYNSSVDEIVTYFNTYNWYDYLAKAQLMFTDSTGNSTVICSNSAGDIISTPKTSHYQEITNFNILQTKLDPTEYPCWRHDILDPTLKALGEPTNTQPLSIEFMAQLSSQVAQRDILVRTYYTVVYDLESNNIHLFNAFNYEHHVQINIQEALQNGVQTYVLNSLFIAETVKKNIRESVRDFMINVRR